MVRGKVMRPLPIFVINLQRDSERRRHMTELLGGLGLEFEFATAVDGRGLTAAEHASYDRSRALRIYGVEMMDNEIACCLSHYRLYERMLRENIEAALIMEDDVRADASLPATVQELLACPATDWLVVRLDSKRSEVLDPQTARQRGRVAAELSGGRTLYRLYNRVLGTGAYVIRRDGAARMLAYGLPIFMPIDQTMDRYWENGILPYVVRPFPVMQREDFGSSTGVRTAGRRSRQPLGVRLQRRLQRGIDAIYKRAFNLAHP